MATIDIVTDSGEAHAAEPEQPRLAVPVAAAAPPTAADLQPGAAQLRTMTLVVTVFGGIITALLGGMFVFMVSALDGVRDEISALRSDMNAEIGSVRGEISALRSDMNDEIGSVRGEISALRNDMNDEIGSVRAEISSLRSDMDQRFAEINAVLLDHTDRLARIETVLDINGRPVSDKAYTPADP